MQKQVLLYLSQNLRTTLLELSASEFNIKAEMCVNLRDYCVNEIKMKGICLSAH